MRAAAAMQMRYAARVRVRSQSARSRAEARASQSQKARAAESQNKMMAAYGHYYYIMRHEIAENRASAQRPAYWSPFPDTPPHTTVSRPPHADVGECARRRLPYRRAVTPLAAGTNAGHHYRRLRDTISAEIPRRCKPHEHSRRTRRLRVSRRLSPARFAGRSCALYRLATAASCFMAVASTIIITALHFRRNTRLGGRWAAAMPAMQRGAIYLSELAGEIAAVICRLLVAHDADCSIVLPMEAAARRRGRPTIAKYRPLDARLRLFADIDAGRR